MAHFADPNRCPSCAGTIAGPVCPTCGLRLVGKTAGELFGTLQYADTLLERLRAETVAAASAPVAAPAVAVTAAPAASGAAAPSAALPTAAAPTAPHRATTVPAVLLTLGGISLASGALIFLVIAWFLLGVGGRTAALVLLTGTLGATTWLAARKDLRAAAETLGTLTALFTGFDLVGARLAWFDAADLRPYAIASGLVLAAACAGGIVALRGRARLWGPEVVGAAGLLVAAVAVLATDHHVPVTMAIVMLGGAAIAWGTRRGRLPVLAIVALALAMIGWLLLVAYGVFSAADDRSAMSTIGPLTTAGLTAVALAVLMPTTRAVTGTLATWLLVGAAVGWTDWFQSPNGWLLTVAVVAAAAAACTAVGGPWRAPSLGVLATGTLVLLGVAAAWAVTLADALDHAAARGWSTRFAASHGAPPWSAMAAVLGLVALAQHLPQARRHPSIATAGAIAAGLSISGYVHWSLVPAAFALLAALVEGGIALRGSRWHWLPAGVLAATAAAVAAVGPGPESVVWWGAAVLGVVVLLRQRTPDRLVSAAAVPTLLGIALLLDGDALDLERRWAGLGTIVLVYAAALALRPRAVRPALSGGALVAMLGAAGVGATSAGWLAAELTVVAAGCAVAGILDRSRIEGLVATAVGLVALWVRLAASDVHTPEAYSLPLAALVLGVGARAMSVDAARRTVPTIGTGLALALVPTWALGLEHPLSLRALAAGLACVALVSSGALLRWLAPLVIGAAAGAVLAVVEIAPYANAVPRWVLLVAIGACLLTAGVRWEALATAGRRTWGRVADLR